MIDRDNIVPENVEGKYYVDEECIWRLRASERECDICREEAPNNFARQESEGYSYVYKQPENEEEESNCRNAMVNCPVEAIGRAYYDGKDLDAAWKRRCIKFGYNRSTPRPAEWKKLTADGEISL